MVEMHVREEVINGLEVCASSFLVSYGEYHAFQPNTKYVSLTTLARFPSSRETGREMPRPPQQYNDGGRGGRGGGGGGRGGSEWNRGAYNLL